jgi:serine acetyltransferase
VVTRDVPTRTLVAGAPARVIRQLARDERAPSDAGGSLDSWPEMATAEHR